MLHILPPCASTIHLHMYNPKPVILDSGEGLVQNFVKRCGKIPGSMPTPESFILIITSVLLLLSFCTSTMTEITSFSLVNLRALSNKLVNTCVILSLSASIKISIELSSSKLCSSFSDILGDL